MEEDLLQTIDKWPVPKGIKEVQGFLGTMGFYRRFIPQYSEIAKLLTDLTREPFVFMGPTLQESYVRRPGEATCAQ